MLWALLQSWQFLNYFSSSEVKFSQGFCADRALFLPSKADPIMAAVFCYVHSLNTHVMAVIISGWFVCSPPLPPFPCLVAALLSFCCFQHTCRNGNRLWRSLQAEVGVFACFLLPLSKWTGWQKDWKWIDSLILPIIFIWAVQLWYVVCIDGAVLLKFRHCVSFTITKWVLK